MTEDQIEAIQKLLNPLRNIWPAIHSELIAACEQQYEPSRLGEILAAEFTKLIDQIKDEHAINPKISITSKHELEMKIFNLTKDKELISRKYEDIQKRIITQNELIANQYQQIQNLTGQADPE